MPHPLRSSLIALTLVACAGCETQDRRMYHDRTHPEKNVRVPSPWAPSTKKAADEAVSPVNEPITPPNSPNPVAPGSPPAPNP